VEVSPVFQINLLDPCQDTKINDQLLQSMITKQNAPTPVTQTFLPFSDFVSQAFGDGSGFDLCGPQTYSLFQLQNGVKVSPPTFIEVDEATRTIRLVTDEDTEITSSYMLLVVTLTEFGITHEEPFQVIIDDCEIDNLTVEMPTTTEFKYDITPSGFS
jgi:hypothetical protein